jgi:hypothetical protein
MNVFPSESDNRSEHTNVTEIWWVGSYRSHSCAYLISRCNEKLEKITHCSIIPVLSVSHQAQAYIGERAGHTFRRDDNTQRIRILERVREKADAIMEWSFGLLSGQKVRRHTWCMGVNYWHNEILCFCLFILLPSTLYIFLMQSWRSSYKSKLYLTFIPDYGLIQQALVLVLSYRELLQNFLSLNREKSWYNFLSSILSKSCFIIPVLVAHISSHYCFFNYRYSPLYVLFESNYCHLFRFTEDLLF